MRALRFILENMKSHRFYFWGMFAFTCLISIDCVTKPYLIKLLIDSATNAHSINVWLVILIFGSCLLMQVGMWTFSDWLSVKFCTSLRIQIAELLARRLQSYSALFFQNHLIGSLAAKVGDAFTLIPSLIFAAYYQGGQTVLTAFFAILILFFVHWFFALGLFVWVCVFLIFTYFCLKRVTPLSKESAESKTTLFGHLADYLGHMINVKLFATGAFEHNRFHIFAQDFLKKARAEGYFLMRFYMIQGTIISIYIMGFLIGLVHLYQAKLITAGDFTLVFMLNFRIFDKMFELSHQLRDFVTNWGQVNQALALFDEKPAVLDAANAAPLVVTRGEITFDNVLFHYKGTKPLFINKSVAIAHGQKVGLVGHSGGGKSTFVNLILRLYDVTGGRIVIDGQDIRHVTQDSLRAHIGMIPQDPALFHRSILENIRYGRLDATDDEVIEAAKKAHAHDFIICLPNGYDSLVGERGVKLSGGQRQRVAIARAILKNAPILVLDEATSQLDSVTESVIQDSLWKTMQGKTSIVIAHRLSTLLQMDRILVFDQGRIIEDGTHQLLLAKGGAYKELWDAQVGGFLADGSGDPDLNEKI